MQAVSFLKRYQVPLFFVLAYGLSWTVWGSTIAQQQGLLSFHVPGTFAYLSVGVAAFLVAGLAGDTDQPQDRRGPGAWRRGPRSATPTSPRRR